MRSSCKSVSPLYTSSCNGIEDKSQDIQTQRRRFAICRSGQRRVIGPTEIEGEKRRMAEEPSKRQALLMVWWAPLHFVLFGALTTFASGLHLVFENFDFEGEGEELNDEEGDDGDEGEGESEAPSKQAFLRCLFFSACVAVAVNGVVKLMTYDTPHLQVTALPVRLLIF